MNDSFCLAQPLVGFALAAHEAGDRERAGLARAALGHRDIPRAGARELLDPSPQ